MADELPVTKLLCDAMEYLTKLGANLRSRSISLTEKRINKNKLKNTHAIQKAAAKVLHICNLSKQSLDNVESGVRRVLAHIDSAQTSQASCNIGGRSPTKEKDEIIDKNVNKNDNYHYIEYESRKLRIAKLISLQNYLSVKVICIRMSISDLNKYPVYHDCELYRIRNNNKSNTYSVYSDSNDSEQNSSVNKQKHKHNTVQTKKYRKLSELPSKKLKEDNSYDNKNNDSVDNKKLSESIGMQAKMYKRVRFSVDSSDDSNDDTSKKEIEKCNENTNINLVSMEENVPNIEATEENELHLENGGNDEKSENIKLDKLEAGNVEKFNLANANEDNVSTSVDISNTARDSDNDLASVIKKPLIKCVNINKLLKPDIVQKSSMNIPKNKIKHSKNKLENEQIDMKEYWEQKRREVRAFKPKKCTVNIERLSKLSEVLLNNYNIKRVIQCGNIVFEVKQEESQLGNSAKKDNIATKDASSHEHITDFDNVQKVKSALLNESDSEQSQINSHENCPNTDNIKESLLKDSDSNENDVNDKQEVITLDSPIEQSDIKELAKNSKQLEDARIDENSANNNTDEGNDSKPVNEKTNIAKKRKIKFRSSFSKRKHIMESMHAKKMLLTYSSSDTEDEKLRETLKEIQNSLLRDSSSDEDDIPILERKNRKLLLQISKGKLRKNKYYNSSSSNDDSDDKMVQNKHSDSSQSSDKMGRTKSKPIQASNSISTNNQDASDKDIDSLANLKSLKKTNRRPDSTSSKVKVEDCKTEKKKNKIESMADSNEDQNMLGSQDTSSNGPSEVESDAADDMPTVTLPGLNGDGLIHLAKDDLLDESDSSSNEKDQTSEDAKQEDDSGSDENVKSKRRKGNTISSDSEAGTGSRSRKKDKDMKLSDFEDSDEESSEAAKRSKRKKATDSDASAGNSSNDGSKKKRRRIKQVNESEASGSDTENEGRNKHGRKNIRKVMSKDQLEEATKKAAREEKERIARITERQKMYNNVQFDESGKPDEVVLEKVVLDFEPETKKPLIEVDRGLVKKLKPHQANGIKFMWDACFESVKRIKKDKGSGCILAHCMGLGKTLQVVTLTHTLLTHADLTGVKRVLIVCPLSTVLNWVNEFRMWLKHAEAEYDVDVYELSRYKQNSERAYQMQQWFEGGGVCVLGYEMFRNLSADNSKKFRKKMLRSFQESLVDPGPDLVVCDEGHLLKNEKTSLSQSMNRVKTYRRIVLTGTPLQNNLKEYYCMVQFVKPNLLGKYNEYLNRFVNPITNGQYTDSTEHDIRVMKRRSHVLHKMLDGAVQRRDYGVLAPFLPPKHEYVLFITLTEVQVKLYQHYLENYSRRPLPGKSSGFLFPDFQSLQRIWTHPLVLKYNSERFEIMQQKKREREEEDSEGSLADFIDDDSTPDETSTEESSDDVSDASDDSRKKSKKKKNTKKGKAKDTKVTTRRGTRANPVEIDEEDKVNQEVEEVKYENPTEWWIKMVSDDEVDDLRNSHKLVLLFNILRECEAIGDKVLVFSQSLYSLDLIEHFLGKIDEATQEARIDEKLGGHVGSWSPGIDYFRLDGSTSCENRSIWCKNFNREDNPRARLFLISTRAGGLGINLVAANRVVIFDVSWNPSHDVQSIFRVYRFGQKKPCYIYRFLAMGTMEEKIYERQVTKQAISKRVIDEQQIDRHYAENDLAELYKFEPTPAAPRPLPPLPKDRLFAELLREHETQIYKYHEHDSLLENKEEETLSEEERKAAWEDFENEKNKPPPVPFPSVWPMHNGMAPGLIAQQQQQLAYAALAAMLRKDMPNINDDQIRNMLPLIYNSNPGLMQKMSEIYKYAQPGMMNPGMMNPAMNSSGMGGTSGLQYEPPWQRQQQQQHQMRLQQLIQQQNQMGAAKFYAGGLGSRDPVAMALQQQRAREMMLGERSRPRGRPPLHAPRADPPSDVVNLADSD